MTAPTKVELYKRAMLRGDYDAAIAIEQEHDLHGYPPEIVTMGLSAVDLRAQVAALRDELDKLSRQPPVAVIFNHDGQHSLRQPDGKPFDMTKHVGPLYRSPSVTVDVMHDALRYRALRARAFRVEVSAAEGVRVVGFQKHAFGETGVARYLDAELDAMIAGGES